MKISKIINSNILYENDYLKLIEDHVLLPQGEIIYYTYVTTSSRCVGVVAIDARSQIYLVSQRRHATNKTSLEIPLGSIKLEEKPIDAAKRELWEECGLIAENWDHLLEMELSGSVTNEKAIIFLASDLEKVESTLDSSENDIQATSIHISDAVNQVLSGVIDECISVSSILSAFIRISN